VTKWLTVKDVAEATQRHPQTVLAAARSGNLHGVQSNGRNSVWRFREGCVDSWVSGTNCEHNAKVTPIRNSARRTA
jgi:hypothetical protein